MNLCPICNQEKNINHDVCGECKQKHIRKKYRDKKEKAVQMLGGKCSQCGYNKNNAALDFHHVNPEEKETTWYGMRSKEWEFIEQELKKCILLCSNCHRELHNSDDLDKPTSLCLNCNKPVYYSLYCSRSCSLKHRYLDNTPSKKELEELLKTKTFTSISQHYDVSRTTINRWLKKYNIYKQKYFRLDIPEKEEIINNINDKTTLTDLSNIFNCSYKTIKKWLDYYDIKLEHKQKNAKPKKKELISILNKELNFTKVANYYDVHRRTITYWQQSYNLPIHIKEYPI